MPGTLPKLSYDALDVASGAKGITVDGRRVDNFGARPHWRKDGSILWTVNNDGQPDDGRVMLWDGSRATVFAERGYEGWSCHNGIFAAWRTTDRLKGISVSESGHKAGIVDLGGSGILEVDGIEIDRGVIYEARYTRDVLVWTKNVNGVLRTFGKLTPSSPIDPLSVLPDDEFWPVALVTERDGVWVLNHGHKHCFVRPWGETQGYIVRVGVADRPDWGQRPDGLARVVYSDHGVLHDHTFSLDAQRTDVRVFEPEQPAPERLPEGTLIDLLPFIVGRPDMWPRDGSHPLHQTWDGRNLHLIKFSSDSWERWVLDGEQFYLREDRSQSGAGCYSMHPGLWFKRRMRVGEWIDVPQNILQRYEPGTCKVLDQHPLPYRIGLVEAWKNVPMGGALGTRDDVRLGYDPGTRNDTIEFYRCADGSGLYHWQVAEQHEPFKTHTTTFTERGGQALTPTQGCWRRDLVPWPPNQPEEPDEDGMTKSELLGTTIDHKFVLGAWTRFIHEALLGRDIIDGTTREESLTDTVGTRGAAMYFFPTYYQETMKAVDRLGHVPRNDAEWGGVSIAGFEAAKALYLRDQAGGGGNPGGGHVDPGPGGSLTRLRVDGRYFANDAGPFDYRELSAFGAYARWLQGRHEQLGQLASVSRGYKVTSWRVILTLSGQFWHNIGTPCGPSIRGFYENLLPFTRWCAEQGIYVRYCLIGGIEEFGGNPVDRRDDFRPDVRERAYDYIRRVTSTLAGEPNVLWNVANEWNQIGLRDSFDRVVEMGRIVRSVAPQILNLSETNGPIADDPMWVREPSDFVDAHLDRRTGMGGFEWVKRSSESGVVDNGRMPFLSGEPINFGTPAPGRPDDCERSPAVAFCYGATSRTKRYLTNFHYHGGLTADVPDGDTTACLDGWRRGLDAIPMTFPGGWCNGHHGCSPWHIDNFPREGENEDAHGGPIRIFGLSGSEGYIGVSVREKSGRRPRERRAVQEIDRVEYGGYASAIYRA